MPVFSRLAVAVQLFSVFVSPVLGAAATQQYDYVIVGGGITGLVVANRLTEDKRKSVLVIEGGDNVDKDSTKIPYKANDLSSAAGLIWDGIKSKPEPGLGGSSYDVYVAKVLGGGSVINGMVYDRGSAADYDAWEALGNNGWGWSGLEPYFIKGTTFQPPSDQVTADFNVTWDDSTYGDGPLKVSITSNQYADIKDYWKAWKATGVYAPQDGNNGEAHGPSWYPNTMDATTGRRAHARYAYYDPITARTNLKILTATTATKILFDDKKNPTMAVGVEITDASGKKSNVYAKKEVVLAAGAIQTPKLLQLSGVGPKSVLKAAGVKVRVELDAVGSNFQDHAYGTVIFNTTTNTFPNQNSLNTNATFNASAWAEYEAHKTGPYTYARGNALAFISLPDMTDDADAVVNSLNSQKDSDYLPAIYKNNAKLLKGFSRQRAIIANLFTRYDAAVAEFPVPADGSFGLVGVEKPLSRGTVYLNASNPSGPPEVSFNAFVNPVDKTILGISLRFFRTVWARPELKRFQISEKVPGAQYKTDDEIFSALLSQKNLSPTLAHPSGSCPMMPEHAGGCVSDKLLVYGTQHLSIIDASIIPIIPSCHLQATMYGIGEKAADVIKQRS
ncbi:GMC oxidoreductase [Cucurbitaria berberidis CBS 394.84]|uniref:GMC oxidoreductase n=1 Tax=Cucurbitaria berberidis CBS 394.84 TaxID=1168544 RepID=A0A9P4GJ00_9PLEO|nr:GMC oxidoreductase [Cucurbitaria berberidis CBS 394.84]KAF1846286.1 GMC oxidoreductase [Cucurbitaria berberidis CBS 394.84]